jgi:hypothetical protein
VGRNIAKKIAMSGKGLFLLGAACALVNFSTGCGKKEQATQETPAESTEAAAATPAPAPPVKAAEAPPTPAPGELPGTSGVRQALASKDYDGAVAQLAGMRASVKREQWEQYVGLQYEVRNALGDASATDPKAAQALLTLNALNRGR